jgi:hypothetical protein
MTLSYIDILMVCGCFLLLSHRKPVSCVVHSSSCARDYHLINRVLYRDGNELMSLRAYRVESTSLGYVEPDQSVLGLRANASAS